MRRLGCPEARAVFPGAELCSVELWHLAATGSARAVGAVQGQDCQGVRSSGSGCLCAGLTGHGVLLNHTITHSPL